ncbi:MAG: hypothetical protein ACXABY_02540 [Candidatus Thorarchaeota archaeon]|jgi:hypothetical protein
MEIRTTISVRLSEAVDADLEGWLDLLAERAGYPLLMDIQYRILAVGDDGQTLAISVSGEIENGG